MVGQARFSHTGAFGQSTCTGYMFFDAVDDPTDCPAHIPPQDRYDPTGNPSGLRCAMADFVANVYGTDPATGFGRPILPDTRGVLYGLAAVEDGVISPEQFVDLNERVGGLDGEGRRTTERSTTDPEALEIAYATGRINQFDGGLTERAELEATTDLGPQELTERARPGGLVDGCWLPTGERVDEPMTLDPDAACNHAFPFHGTPRMAAGGSAASDVVACSVTALDATAIDAEFTDEQWARLQAVFPDGVCDWDASGVGQVPLADTWLRF